MTEAWCIWWESWTRWKSKFPWFFLLHLSPAFQVLQVVEASCYVLVQSYPLANYLQKFLLPEFEINSSSYSAATENQFLRCYQSGKMNHFCLLSHNFIVCMVKLIDHVTVHNIINNFNHKRTGKQVRQEVALLTQQWMLIMFQFSLLFKCT